MSMPWPSCIPQPALCGERQTISGARLEEGGRYVLAQDGGRIVSAVCTTVETSNAAMVGGVFTPDQAAQSWLCHCRIDPPV